MEKTKNKLIFQVYYPSHRQNRIKIEWIFQINKRLLDRRSFSLQHRTQSGLTFHMCVKYDIS